MPATHDGACPRHAGSIAAGFVTIVAGSAAALAQAPHPFAPPAIVPAFALHPAVACLDVNRDGCPDLVSPGLFGGTLVHTLDEAATTLTANGPGPWGTTPGTVTTIASVLALAAGRIDVDGRDDLVSVTSAGTVHFHRNLGSTRLGCAHCAPDVLVDDWTTLWPVNPPLMTYSFPALRVVDLDGDGWQDVILAGGPVDRWNAATRPGGVVLYRGNGRGGFTAHRFPTTGCVIDAEPADLDGDGTLDHVVVLQETGSLGTFAYDLLHLAWLGGALVATTAPQPLGNGRYTDLALADVTGDTNRDYLLARTVAGIGTTWADVSWYAGDGQGQASTTNWGTFWLPANPTTLGDTVPAIHSGDFDRDGHVDLAVLRGFVQPGSGPGQAATHAPAELLVAMGPNLPFAAFTSLPLPGHVRFADTNLFGMLPLQPAPGFLQAFDLGCDGSPDLLVAALQQAGPTTPTAHVVLANTTPAGPLDGGFTKVGAPSGGATAHPARLGFDGGAPRLGNAAFATTLLGVQGGSLVGLVWGPLASPGLFVSHGIDVHLVPALLGYAAFASGTAAGEGFHSDPLPIPTNPALLGDAGCFQYVYHDHVVGAFGGSQATSLRIGL